MDECHQMDYEFLPVLELLCKQYWAKGDSGRAEIYQHETINVPGLGGSKEFPATYSVIDPGPNLCKLFPQQSPRLLLRQEYKHVKNHIHRNQEIEGCWGIVITGQPGIGKSCFLLYLLIERVLNGEITAWSPSCGIVYLLLGADKVEVHTSSAWSLNTLAYPGAWALVDTTEESVRANPQLTHPHSDFFIVQAAPPLDEGWDDWFIERSGCITVMQPWSWEEIFIGGTQLQSSHPLSATKLERVFVMYGPSASQCFEFARDEQKMEDWEQQIPQLLEECPKFVMAASSTMLLGMFGGMLPEDLLFRIFCIVPDKNLFPCSTLVSAHVADHVFKVLAKRDPREFQALCDRFRKHAESQDAAKWLEDALHGHASSSRRTELKCACS